MEALAEIDWDVIISGTGLQQSLLALSLSRSKKNVLHVDPNEYYGGAEAALSLQDADEWAERQTQNAEEGSIFSNAQIEKASDGLSFSRAYSLALAPQLIHAKSELLDQLVSSKAFRQVEFLAVGSFYIFRPATVASSSPTLDRVPSTREDVFSNTAIPAKSKRALMKFLKFVLSHQEQPQRDLWQPKASMSLSGFLETDFKLDRSLQSYVVALTLSQDGMISVEDGLQAIFRHLSSMGRFGAGFAAVYPKWGGLSEVAQVGCRASAVGGATYMLGTGVESVAVSDAGKGLSIELSNDSTLRTRNLVKGSDVAQADGVCISRLTAVVSSDLSSMFVGVVEGSPTPAAVIVAFPSGAVTTLDDKTSESPIYGMVHSSDTGECPKGQSVIYLSTVSSPSSTANLNRALDCLLDVVSGSGDSANVLYRLSYTQRGSGSSKHQLEVTGDGTVACFPSPSVALSFDDGLLKPVQEAWKLVMSQGNAEVNETEYMNFADREGVEAEDDIYED